MPLKIRCFDKKNQKNHKSHICDIGLRIVFEFYNSITNLKHINLNPKPLCYFSMMSNNILIQSIGTFV